jgi:hypothetical protein
MDHWPNLTNEHKCIEKYLHPEGCRCLFVIERSDGTFSMCGYELVDGWQGEMVWTTSDFSQSIYAEKAVLLTDMNSSQLWTKNVKPSYNT